MGSYAWVTLATNDSYSLGALVLAHSLKRVGTTHKLVVLITPGVTEAMKTQLSAVFNVVKVVDVLDSGDANNLALMARPDLGITFTKLHCWKLTQFDKCVFLDADTLALQNCDELFEREELSAAPDAGWPDCFNSGVFVYKPSDDTFKALIEFALVHGSFDGGDQGLLNLFYSDWATKDIKKHLSFVYNMVSPAMYSYLPAFKQFGGGVKIIHFIGSIKPWLQPFNTETGLVQVRGESPHVTQFLQMWWDLFCTSVHPILSTEMAGLAGALASITLGTPLSAEQAALEEHLRRQEWEQGNIDYLGKDSFSNIWQKICETLASTRISADEPTVPVAPVVGPTFVSSVEISPSGTINISPPASSAPVSASIPTTVLASDTGAATSLVAPAEATTVNQQKSSVAELGLPSAALDPGAKPTTTSTDISDESTSLTLVSTVPAELVSSAAPATPLHATPSQSSNAVLPDQTGSVSTVTTEKFSSEIVFPEVNKTTETPVPIQAVKPSTPSPITLIQTDIQTPCPLSSTQNQTFVPDSIPLTSIPADKAISVPIPPMVPNNDPVNISGLPSSSPTESSESASTPPAVHPKETLIQSSSAIVESPELVGSAGNISVSTKSILASDSSPPASLPLTPVSSPPSSQTTPPVQTQHQPQTPTVTEPTPPTSPPTEVVEIPLAAKLQVEAEVPVTPPVDSNSGKPTLSKVPSDDPPVPPKRKGGSKSTQEAKGQKGKPAKGKK